MTEPLLGLLYFALLLAGCFLLAHAYYFVLRGLCRRVANPLRTYVSLLIYILYAAVLVMGLLVFVSYVFDVVDKASHEDWVLWIIGGACAAIILAHIMAFPRYKRELRSAGLFVSLSGKKR